MTCNSIDFYYTFYFENKNNIKIELLNIYTPKKMSVL